MTNDILRTNEALRTNEYLVSASGKCFLIVQADSNVVLYRGDGPGNNQGALWGSGTGGQSADDFFVITQSDGNLVVYRGTPENNRGVIWATNTVRQQGSYFLRVQDDENLVVYAGTGPGENQGIVWARSNDDALHSSIGWVYRQGPPSRDGSDGKNYEVWVTHANNPWDHPSARTGNVKKSQLPGGGWEIRVLRGNTSGRDCVRNALADVREGQRSNAISWLCAGQAHNPTERQGYTRDPDQTLAVLTRYFRL